MYCGYCGRLLRRCVCHEPGSNLARFMARAVREAKPRQRSEPYKRAVPPQIKRRERATLRARHERWHQKLSDDFGKGCANCGATESLVLDHIIPIAKGGRSALDNLQLLCAECNRLKGKLVIDCRDFTSARRVTGDND